MILNKNNPAYQARKTLDTEILKKQFQTMLSHKKALDYFRNLYLVAVADSQLAKEETSFLVQVAQYMGIGPREAADIMMGGQDAQLVIPESEEARVNQLEDIVVMMMVDKKIHEKEYELCIAYAKAIGKDKKMVDETILNIIRGN